MDIVIDMVTNVIENGTVDQAISLMDLLRKEAMRLDRYLADPRHPWNSVNK